MVRLPVSRMSFKAICISGDSGLPSSPDQSCRISISDSDLSRERSEQRTDRFAVGEKVDAKVTSVDQKNRKVTLSIKAREMDEDKQALETFGSTESGASLGDILGAALSSSKTADAPATEEKPKAKKAAAKKAPAKKAAKKADAKADKAEEKNAE